MKFNRGVAFGTSLVLILAACGDSSASRSRNALVPKCFESVEALKLVVVPAFDKFNEAKAMLPSVEAELARVIAEDKVVREAVPQELIDAEKNSDALEEMGESKKFLTTYTAMKFAADSNKKTLLTGPVEDGEEIQAEIDALTELADVAYAKSMIALEKEIIARNKYLSLVADRADQLTSSRSRVLVAEDNLKMVTTALTESEAIYVANQDIPICPPTLSAGDAEAGDVEESASATSTSTVQYQFEDEPLSEVPVISGGDAEGSGAGDANSTATTSRPAYQFEDTPLIELKPIPILRSADPESGPVSSSPPTTAYVRQVFIFEEGEPLPPLEDVSIPTIPSLPPESSPTIPASGKPETQTIVNITIPNEINDKILNNIINIYNNTTNNTSTTTNINETSSTVANRNEILICYVDNKPLPITITTIPITNKSDIIINNNKIIENNVNVSNDNQVVTIIRIPRVIRDNPLDESSPSSSAPSSSSEPEVQSVFVSVAGFEKKASVTVSVAETNTPITTFTTDKDGAAVQEVVIPVSAQASSLNLVVAGTNDKQQSVVMPVPLAVVAKKSSTPTENTVQATTSIVTEDSVMSDTTMTVDSSPMVDDAVEVTDDSTGTNIFGYWWVLLMILVLILSIFRFKSYKKVDDESSVRDI